MKLAVLTSGILPVPAVQGGAVENLIDYYLEYNNQHHLHDITVYSIAPPHSTPKADASTCTHYHYIDVKSFIHRLKRAWYVRTHKGGYYNGYIGYFLHEAMKHIKHQHFDAIILENRPGYAISLTQVTDAKLIIHLHNDLLNSESKQAQAIARACHSVITVSHFIKQRVETLSPCQQIKITTIHNGIDLQRFYQATPLSRTSFGFTDKDFIIVYSGRINREKGVKELIQAFKRLKDYTDIKLMVIGSSFFGNEQGGDPFIQSLQEEAEELANRIIFTGYIPYGQIPSYLKMADVAVIPSMWNEPFALTLVEAMAAGLPIVATHVGAISEVSQGSALLLEKQSFVEEFPKSILHLYRDPSLRLAMKEKGLSISKQYVKERYAEAFFKAVKV